MGGHRKRALRREPHSDRQEARREFSCSFCGKSRRDVQHLISGPLVYICDECVGLCAEIIGEDAAGASGGRRAKSQLPAEGVREATMQSNHARVLGRLHAQERLSGVELGAIRSRDRADHDVFHEFDEVLRESSLGEDERQFGMVDHLGPFCQYVERCGGTVLKTVTAPSGVQFAALRVANGLLLIVSERLKKPAPKRKPPYRA